MSGAPDISGLVARVTVLEECMNTYQAAYETALERFGHQMDAVDTHGAPARGARCVNGGQTRVNGRPDGHCDRAHGEFALVADGVPDRDFGPG